MTQSNSVKLINTMQLIKGMKQLLLKLLMIRKEVLGDMEAVQYPE